MCESRVVLGAFGLLCFCSGWLAPTAHAQSAAPAARLELRFEPAPRAQLALWIERDEGELLATVRLTEAVALRGIGNRPGASQMNSGFRWPYGRREGALPIWAMRRASAPSAKPFRRVVFQDRASEGFASRTSRDSTPDDYFCLSFVASRSSKDALDAMSCATQFSSDKGRFLTEADVEAGYAEPYEVPLAGRVLSRPLSLDSLYPPRRDARPCEGSCIDHPDAASFAAHALEVMPELDAVTMATPQSGVEQRILYRIPPEWSHGAYRACLEINVEGDYNATFDDHSYPTPASAANPECEERDGWDFYAQCYGYPYRGQPSVVYCADFTLGAEEEAMFGVSTPTGAAGTWDVMAADFGELQSMEGMTDDPVSAPGSGADRLRQRADGARLEVVVLPAASCNGDQPPSAVTDLSATRHPSELHAHEWTRLNFRAAGDDQSVFRYEIRVSTEPITDEASFLRAMPAKAASIEAPELFVPTDTREGERVELALGGLTELTHYYVGVRAMDGCAGLGALRTVELTTPKRVFATVSPCMVATAAWGTPLAHEVGVLRRLRDRYLQPHPLGRALVSGYYAIGPHVADVIRERPRLRAVARGILTPLIALASRLG